MLTPRLNTITPQVCAWLSLFLREARAKDCTAAGLVLPVQSKELDEACSFSDHLMSELTAELRTDSSDGEAYTYSQ